MTISDYQISNVIKTYMKSMKIKANRPEKGPETIAREDHVQISEEAMKRMLFERIEERMTEKSRPNVHSAG
jgi:hypothetical protein